ncbi:MAG: SDR family oxidoreductase [Rhodobacteraceae bacterium]|nr:MAG: SDR family oxidoreductase [Paracoccaceae bacterium]
MAEALAGMRVLVVGGTSGIGFACARASLDAGAAAARVVGRDATRGAAAAAALGPRAAFLRADCADTDAVERMVADAEAAMGGIDGLVCAPGTTHLPELLHRQPLSAIREALTLDLAPVLYCCRAVLPGMMARRAGAIVCVASDAGKIATPGESVIGAGMAAIVQFVRGLAIEAKRDGVRANTITPSLVEGTPLTERLMGEGRFSAKLFAKARTLAHLGTTTPEDVAALAVFLLSPAAGRITGQAISVNGGISAA